MAHSSLSPAQLEAFGAELDGIRARVVADLGERDAKYIRRMMRIQRAEGLVTRTLGNLPKTESATRARLEEALEFYSIARKSTQEVISQWSSRKRGST